MRFYDGQLLSSDNVFVLWGNDGSSACSCVISHYAALLPCCCSAVVVCRVAGPAAGLNELNPIAPAPVVITSASQPNISAYFLPTRANGGSPYGVTLYASDNCSGKGRCMKGVGVPGGGVEKDFSFRCRLLVSC